MHSSCRDIHDLIFETHAAYEVFGEYYDLMYAAQGRKAGIYRSDVADAFTNLISSRGSKNILDCACGTGDPIIGVALKLSADQCDSVRITACDASEKMIYKCNNNAIVEGITVNGTEDFTSPSIHIIQSCWDELLEKFGTNRFDMVMCVGHGFFHLISRQKMISALRSMTEVLKPGGYVVFDVKRWDKNDDLHQEIGVEPVKWRNWVQDDDKRVMFLSTSNWYDDPRAVDGVIQLKNFYVLEEGPSGLQTKASCLFWGAPLRVTTAFDIAREAGLSDVQEVVLDMPKDKQAAYLHDYVTIIGKKSNG